MDAEQGDEPLTRGDLTGAVQSYFDLMDGPAVSLVVETFTPDAVVVDDGNTYTGHAAIRAWLSGPANQFTTTSTWLFVRPADRGTEVGILIEGDFPGGRVELRYDFTHDRDGLIEALTISI